jgi:colanic acid/amylovoran biosynthesis glycosyltransferase
MCVLMTTYAFPDDRQAFIEQYVRALVNLGMEVCVVVTAGDDERRAPHSEPDGSPLLTVIRAPWSDPRRRKAVTLAKALRDAARYRPRALRRLLSALWRRHGFKQGLVAQLYVLTPVISRPVDVVHIGWLIAATHWIDLMPAIEGPLVVSCHGSDVRINPLEENGYRERLAAVFARADLVHCVSGELASRAIALGLDPAKVFVRAWGVDTARFRPALGLDPRDEAVAQPRPIRLVSVGRLHWVKGYEYALLALAQVRRAGIDVEYTIIGDGTERDRLPVLVAVRDLDLGGCVHLLGARPQEEVLETLRASDLFLVSSVSEGLSIATLEAMAVGLPVVVTDVGGMSEAVSDGVEGRVVPPRDPKALADAILELASDPARRAAMGQRGRRRAVEDFDSAATAKVMREHYLRLVDAAPGGAGGGPTR